MEQSVRSTYSCTSRARAGRDSSLFGKEFRAVIDETKAAGVYVFGDGIDEAVPPVLVSADGRFTGGYSWAPPLNGGFTVLELPSREEAIAWAARIAKGSWLIFDVGRNA